MRPTKFGLGQPVLRLEDERFITGAGEYTSDVAPAGVLHALVLRSPHAKARFTLDAAEARALPGVALVLTAADVAHLGAVPTMTPLPNSDGSNGVYPPIPLLCDGEVRHVGDAVAFIVAETLDQARDALEAIAVDWEPEAATGDLKAAVEPGAPLVHPAAPGNVAYTAEMGDKTKVDAAFAAAAKTVTLEIVNNRLITNYMETRAAVAEYDAKAESFTLTVSSQGVHGLRDNLARNVLKIGADKLRVVTPDVGGGFGTKTFVYREYGLVCEAARRLGRPVSWTQERGDHFQSCAHGRDNVTIAEVAMDEGGRFLAMRFDWLGGLGAYPHQYGPYIHNLGATMLTGPYATPLIYARVRGVYTNTVPTDAYRGAGRPEASFTLERLVDYAAREIGMEPAALRELNFIKPSAMPYKTPIGDRTYDVGEFSGHLKRVMEIGDAAGFAAREAHSKARGKLRGIGLACYIECTAWGNGEAVTMHLDGDGGVTLYSGTQSNGQGHKTAYTQFVSQILNLPTSMIRVVQGDTARVATGHGTGGSRSIPVGGVSAYVSATNLAEKLKALAADELEAGIGDLEIADGSVRIVGTDRALSFAQIARLPSAKPDAVTAQGEFVPPAATYPNGSHLVELEIDPETGHVAIDRYHICDDFGMSVNPILLAGQVHGGAVQGIGQAIHERTVYDEDGQLQTASFMDYGLPRAEDVPGFVFETRNVPSTTNPLGIKGAGEAGSIGSTPAVMNGICDALHRAYGIAHIDQPATPERLWAVIDGARSRN